MTQFSEDFKNALSWIFTIGLCECFIFFLHTLYYEKYLLLPQTSPFILATNCEGIAGAMMMVVSLMVFHYVREKYKSEIKYA
jgi:hypothetical protein